MKAKSILIVTLSLSLILNSCGKKTKEGIVERHDIDEIVFASGVLEPENQYNLTAQVEGYLSSLAMEEGDLVSAGQVLGIIDNPQNRITSGSARQLLGIAKDNAAADAPALRQVEANIRAASEKVKQDQVQVDRFRKLFLTNSVSKLEVENTELSLSNSKANLEALQDQLAAMKRNAEQQVVVQRSQSEVNQVMESYNVIRANLPGKVYKRFKQQGDFVRRGEVIAMIGNPTTLHARLSVDEGNIAKLRLGQATTIRLNVDEKKPMKAQLSKIRPAFDEATQSFLVEANFLDSLYFKVAGTQLEANIHTGTHANTLVIPRDFLGYGDVVRVARDSGEVKQAVVTGFVSSQWVEILEGLKEGERIVTDVVK